MLGKFYSRVYTSRSQKESKAFECRLNREGFRYDHNCEDGIVLKDTFGRVAKIEFKY